MNSHTAVMLATLLLLAGTGCAVFRGTESDKPLPEPTEPVRLSFHLASSSKAEGLAQTTDENDRPLYLDTDPFLTDRDVWNAAAFINPQRAMVRLDFTPDGAATLERVTREHPGHRMAVFLNDALIMSPGWPSPIVAGTVFLYDDFSPARARQIAAQLNAQRIRRGPTFDKPAP